MIVNLIQLAISLGVRELDPGLEARLFDASGYHELAPDTFHVVPLDLPGADPERGVLIQVPCASSPGTVIRILAGEYQLSFYVYEVYAWAYTRMHEMRVLTQDWSGDGLALFGPQKESVAASLAGTVLEAPWKAAEALLRGSGGQGAGSREEISSKALLAFITFAVLPALMDYPRDMDLSNPRLCAYWKAAFLAASPHAVWSRIQEYLICHFDPEKIRLRDQKNQSAAIG